MSKRWTQFLLIAVLVALPLVACQQAEQPAEEPEAADTETEMTDEAPGAVAEAEDIATLATLESPPGSTVEGTVRFVEQDGAVKVMAVVKGVERAGLHGIHIHENGSCEGPDYKSAGGHLNPAGVDHACPPTTPRHAGDLGNIEVGDDGTGSLELTTDLISIAEGDDSVVGKAMILHAGEDDCQTQPTGDAGARLACGVIALSQPAAEDTMEVEPGEGGEDMADEEMSGEEM